MIKKIIILMSAVFLQISCCLFNDDKPVFQCISVINDSNEELSFYPYSMLPISRLYGELYPDTILPPDNIGLYGVTIHALSSYTYRTIFEKKIIPERFSEKDTLMFFVFSVDTLDKYSWEEIREDYKILKRYDLTIHELDSMNWTINYP